MTILGAFAIAVTVGLAIVGAVLLRNEDKVRDAWLRRRAGKEPLAPRLTVAFWGLFTAASVGLAVASGEAIRIALSALYVVLFARLLRHHKRSQRAT
jgi:hypothetical protein